jgi:hypothetical protein
MKELQSRRSFWVERRDHLWPAMRVNIGQGTSPCVDYILLHKSWFGRLVCWDIQVRLQQLDTPTTNIDKPANQPVAHILLHLICLSNMQQVGIVSIIMHVPCMKNAMHQQSLSPSLIRIQTQIQERKNCYCPSCTGADRSEISVFERWTQESNAICMSSSSMLSFNLLQCF